MRRVMAGVGLLALALVAVACGGGGGNSGTAGMPGMSGTATGAGSRAQSTATSMAGMSGMSGMSGSPMAGMGMLDDQSFLAMMIQHHQAAVDMAQIALQRAEHPELKQLAQSIITSQQAEITQMRAWQQAWFGGATPTAMSGMSSQQMGMSMDLNALKTANPFDKAFIDDMIPHHQGAVMMAQQILQTTQRPELKQLAQSIIGDQTKEIDQMRQWRTAWYGQ